MLYIYTCIDNISYRYRLLDINIHTPIYICTMYMYLGRLLFHYSSH